MKFFFAPRPVQNFAMRFLFFHGCFREECPAKHAPPELFGGLCGFLTGAHFVDKLGSHAGSIVNSTETGAKLKKRRLV